MYQEIFIIDDDDILIQEIKEIFYGEREFRFKKVKVNNLEEALKSIPALIIINEDHIEEDMKEVCKKIRADEDNSITPIIIISSNNDKEHKKEILTLSVEYYLINPEDKEFIYYNIKNILRLIQSNRTVSPLTGLPGNVQIQAETKKRILNKDEFTVLYFDLDNFKAYNDVYGFFKGDEIIKFTATTILRHIHSNEFENCFVGHIGGDDFVAITEEVEVESICQDIIAEFDSQIKKYFYEEDLRRGYLEVANRKNIMEQFPIVSLSIGVVEVETDRFNNILELGEVGAQVKHLAKTIMGSSYIIDRRT